MLQTKEEKVLLRGRLILHKTQQRPRSTDYGLTQQALHMCVTRHKLVNLGNAAQIEAPLF